MNNYTSLLIFVFVVLVFTACKTNISLFNKVPKNYYTRHHFKELNTPERTAIACLQKSDKKKDVNVAELNTSNNSSVQNDYSVYKSHNLPTFDYSIRPIYEQTYRKERFENDEITDIKDRGKLFKVLDIVATSLGLLAFSSIFLGSAEFFLGLTFTAITIALISSIKNPEKQKQRELREKRKAEIAGVEEEISGKVKSESKEAPLSAEERQALDIEKAGFLSFVAGFFSIFLTALAFGPYYSAIIVAFIPFITIFSLALGIASLKIHKSNPRKYRGKGYAYLGIGLSGLMFLAAIFLIIAFLIFLF